MKNNERLAHYFYRIVAPIAIISMLAQVPTDSVHAQAAAQGASNNTPDLSNSLYLPLISNQEAVQVSEIEQQKNRATEIFVGTFAISIQNVTYSSWETITNGASVVTNFNRVLEISAALIQNAGFDPANWASINSDVELFELLATTSGTASTHRETGGDHIIIRLNANILAQVPQYTTYLQANESAHLLFDTHTNRIIEEVISEMHAVNVASQVSPEAYGAAYSEATSPVLRILGNGSDDLLYIIANRNVLKLPGGASTSLTYIEESLARELTRRNYQADGAVDLTKVYKYKNGDTVDTFEQVFSQMQQDKLFQEEPIARLPKKYSQVAFREAGLDSLVIRGFTTRTSDDTASLEPALFAANNDLAKNLFLNVGYTNAAGTRTVAVINGYTIENDHEAGGGVKITFPETFVGADGRTYTTTTNGNTMYVFARPENNPNIQTRAYIFPVGETVLSAQAAEAELAAAHAFSQ